MSDDVSDSQGVHEGLFQLAALYPEGFTYEDAAKHFGWPHGSGPAIPSGWHSDIVRRVFDIVEASATPITSVEVDGQMMDSSPDQPVSQKNVRRALNALANTGSILRTRRLIGGLPIVTWHSRTLPTPADDDPMRPPALEPSRVLAHLRQSSPQTSREIAAALDVSRNLVQKALRVLLEAGQAQPNGSLWSALPPRPPT